MLLSVLELEQIMPRETYIWNQYEHTNSLLPARIG